MGTSTNPLKRRFPAIQIGLLRAIRRQIARYPDSFDMGSYLDAPGASRKLGTIPICKTAACLAGEAVLLRGGRLFLGREDGFRRLKLRLPDGTIDTPESAHHHAQQMLGLTHAQAFYLFMGRWSERGTWVSAEETVQYLDRLLQDGDPEFPAD